jgi:hypothetical protein
MIVITPPTPHHQIPCSGSAAAVAWPPSSRWHLSWAAPPTVVHYRRGLLCTSPGFERALWHLKRALFLPAQTFRRWDKVCRLSGQTLRLSPTTFPGSGQPCLGSGQPCLAREKLFANREGFVRGRERLSRVGKGLPGSRKVVPGPGRLSANWERLCATRERSSAAEKGCRQTGKGLPESRKVVREPRKVVRGSRKTFRGPRSQVDRAFREAVIRDNYFGRSTTALPWPSLLKPGELRYRPWRRSP